MATLQKQLSRKVGKKKYVKYIIVIPSEAVKKAGFREGKKLKIDAKKGRITIY